MDSEGHILHLELADSGAARDARRAVSDITSDLRALDRADVMLLTSELLGLALTGASASATLDVWRDGDNLRFEATGSAIHKPVDPVVAALFDQLASAWSIANGSASFAIAKPFQFVEQNEDRVLFQRMQTGDETAKDELARRYERFARSLSSKYVRSSTKREDLEQVAAIGLLKALERFDVERGIKFTTYAAKTIDGELKRFLRDKGWSLRVPRGLQELSLEAKRAADVATQAHGREPSLKEIAGTIDADPAEVGQAMLAAKSFDAASLDAPIGGDSSLPLGDALPSHDQRLETAPEWADLSSVMDALPSREKRILYLRFFEDLSQSEIADRVGISQMHVSRLLAQSIEDLRLWIGITSEQQG